MRFRIIRSRFFSACSYSSNKCGFHAPKRAVIRWNGMTLRTCAPNLHDRNYRVNRGIILFGYLFFFFSKSSGFGDSCGMFSSCPGCGIPSPPLTWLSSSLLNSLLLSSMVLSSLIKLVITPLKPRIYRIPLIGYMYPILSLSSGALSLALPPSMWTNRESQYLSGFTSLPCCFTFQLVY